jgi:hypothetical protein
MNDQVLAFIKVTAPLLTKTGVDLDFLNHMENLNAQQRGFVNQLVKIFRQDLIRVVTNLANIPLLPDMDNRKSQLFMLLLYADTDIPLLMKMLATRHPSGQQRVIHLFVKCKVVVEMLDAIKEVETQNIFLNLKTNCSGFPQFYQTFPTTLLHKLPLHLPARQYACKKCGRKCANG